jgi:hypothetical protein
MRTGNNYSGARWLHSRKGQASKVSRPAASGVSVMGGSGRRPETMEPGGTKEERAMTEKERLEQYGGLVTAENIELYREILPRDQARELEVGCRTWPITYGSQRGQMTVWPSGRGAVWHGGDSVWGEWDGHGILTADDTSTRYDDNGEEVEGAGATNTTYSVIRRNPDSRNVATVATGQYEALEYGGQDLSLEAATIELGARNLLVGEGAPLWHCEPDPTLEDVAGLEVDPQSVCDYLTDRLGVDPAEAARLVRAAGGGR